MCLVAIFFVIIVDSSNTLDTGIRIACELLLFRILNVPVENSTLNLTNLIGILNNYLPTNGEIRVTYVNMEIEFKDAKNIKFYIGLCASNCLVEIE